MRYKGEYACRVLMRKDLLDTLIIENNKNLFNKISTVDW